MADQLTVTIDLPDGLGERMRQRMKSLQFYQAQFYIRWLLAKDVAPESDDADLHLALVYEGMNSGGESIPFDDEFKRRFIAETDKMIEAKAAAAAGRAAG